MSAGHEHKASGPGESRVARHRPTRRALLGALAVTVVFLGVESAGGWLSGSLALLSDAGHMLADVFALLLSLFALNLAGRKATPAKTYGYLRLEILSALANGVLLSLVAIFIFREAWVRFFTPHPVRAGILLPVAATGLVANLFSAWLLHGRSDNLNVRGAYLHILADALSSLGVLIGGLFILATGESRIDTAIGAVIGLIILWSAQSLVREAVDVLLEASPKGLHSLEVHRAILESASVVAVHDLHVWSLTTGVGALSAHVCVRREDLPETDRILDQINERLRCRFGISHTTIQIESAAASHACVVDE